MSYHHLLTEDNERVRILTLNRPDKRNALSLELMLELIDALGDARSEPGIRVIVIAAEGSAFSAGHDLTELAGRSRSDYEGLFEVCTELMLLLQAMPQPVIAEVKGLATAAGCQLVAACDLAIASESARFATPGVKIGLFCTTPAVPLVRAVGRKRAMEMLLTATPIDAKTAQSWGLINRVVPEGQLRDSSMELAGQIMEASAATLASGKRAFYEQIALNDSSAYAKASRAMADHAVADDAQEGISAFLEKRRPVWR